MDVAGRVPATGGLKITIHRRYAHAPKRLGHRLAANILKAVKAQAHKDLQAAKAKAAKDLKACKAKAAKALKEAKAKAAEAIKAAK